MIPSWRFPAGVAIFALGFCAPLAIPLVTASGLPPGWKAVISGALAVGVPEVMMVIATAVMGKEGFAELKRRLGRFFGRYGPPDTVGPTRYRIGLVMFAVPLLLGWLGPYLHHHLPGFDSHPMVWHLGGDLMLFASLFVLGGDFWDKLRSLFVQGAKAVFPGSKYKGESDD
jgi:hypothetical protein